MRIEMIKVYYHITNVIITYFISPIPSAKQLLATEARQTPIMSGHVDVTINVAVIFLIR